METVDYIHDHIDLLFNGVYGPFLFTETLKPFITLQRKGIPNIVKRESGSYFRGLIGVEKVVV